MHKRLVNEARLTLSLEVRGPILVKSGAEGLDPTRPSMEFMRTRHPRIPDQDTVFLPGSSLKGTVRAHAERILRTLELPCCDPFCDESVPEKSCSRKLDKHAPRKELTGADSYARACLACRLFGCGGLSSRIRFSDAYPPEPVSDGIDQRPGVAIDRVLGSVAVGPFLMESLTAGRFDTSITVQNFELWQLALLGLVLRELEAGRLPLGFGKSRGFGQVVAKVEGLTLRVLAPRGLTQDATGITLQGVGAAMGSVPCDQLPARCANVSAEVALGDVYGMVHETPVKLEGLRLGEDLELEDDGLGTTVKLVSKAARDALFRGCVSGGWKELREIYAAHPSAKAGDFDLRTTDWRQPPKGEREAS